MTDWEDLDAELAKLKSISFADPDYDPDLAELTDIPINGGNVGPVVLPSGYIDSRMSYTPAMTIEPRYTSPSSSASPSRPPMQVQQQAMNVRSTPPPAMRNFQSTPPLSSFQQPTAMKNAHVTPPPLQLQQPSSMMNVRSPGGVEYSSTGQVIPDLDDMLSLVHEEKVLRAYGRTGMSSPRSPPVSPRSMVSPSRTTYGTYSTGFFFLGIFCM
jgi:hypothetical protein